MLQVLASSIEAEDLYNDILDAPIRDKLASEANADHQALVGGEGGAGDPEGGESKGGEGDSGGVAIGGATGGSGLKGIVGVLQAAKKFKEKVVAKRLADARWYEWEKGRAGLAAKFFPRIPMEETAGFELREAAAEIETAAWARKATVEREAKRADIEAKLSKVRDEAQVALNSGNALLGFDFEDSTTQQAKLNTELFMYVLKTSAMGFCGRVT